MKSFLKKVMVILITFLVTQTKCITVLILAKLGNKKL